MKGFKILNGDTMSITMPVDRSIVEKGCKIIKSRKLTKLKISNQYLQRAFDSLNFLKDFSKVADRISEVNLFGCFADFNNLYIFNNLEYLFCTVENDEKIDLSRFTKINTLFTSRIESYTDLNDSSLKELCFHNSEAYPNPKLDPAMLSQLRQLRVLRLLENVRDFSFEDVHGLDNLQFVIISQCNIKNLNGIEKFTALRRLIVWYCYSLNDISAIKSLPNLVSLELGPCPRIKDISDLVNNNVLRVLSLINFKELDIEIIRSIKELRFLYLQNCKSIPSIRFIDDLKNLMGLLILGTKIVDGDLTPAMRLKYAGTVDMKHYNIKSDKLPNGKFGYPYWSNLDNILKS